MKVIEKSEKAGLKLNIQTTKIIASGPSTSWQIDGETMEIMTDFFFFFLGLKITVDDDCSQEIKRFLLLGKKAMTNLDSVLKSKDLFADKDPYSQNYGFPSSHVWMWVFDHKEGLALKNWCFWSVMLGKTLESPLDSKKIKPVNLKGNQSWILIRGTGTEAPILWLPDVKSWLTGKEPDAGKDWKQKEKRTAEDEMVR